MFYSILININITIVCWIFIGHATVIMLELNTGNSAGFKWQNLMRLKVKLLCQLM